VALLDEPPGWRHLQAMAQQEKDPHRLAFIIDQMNCLLDRHEKMSPNENTWMGVSRGSHNSIKLDVQSDTSKRS
jgi:hypothetical protein